MLIEFTEADIAVPLVVVRRKRAGLTLTSVVTRLQDASYVLVRSHMLTWVPGEFVEFVEQLTSDFVT